MDDKEYLNQLSSTVRPEKKPKMSFMSSLYFKIIAGGVIGFILLAILGSILGNKGNVKSQLIALKLHLDNTSSVVSNYQKSVKSSDLRSTSASLYSVLTNTSRDVNDYITAKFGSKGSTPEKNVAERATQEKDGLEAELMEAKINGLLDRVFTMKMKYEVSTFMAEEADIHNTTGDNKLREILDSSYSSLENLYNKLDSFSETK